NFVVPETIREGPGHVLYVADYSAIGTGAIIAVDPNTLQQSIVATGGNIINPVALAIDNANNLLYVLNLNVGGSGPRLVQIDLSKGTQTVLTRFTPGSLTPAGLAFDPIRGVLYLADEGTALPTGERLGQIFSVNVQTGALTALPSFAGQGNSLDHM